MSLNLFNNQLDQVIDTLIKPVSIMLYTILIFLGPNTDTPKEKISQGKSNRIEKEANS